MAKWAMCTWPYGHNEMAPSTRSASKTFMVLTNPGFQGLLKHQNKAVQASQPATWLWGLGRRLRS